MQTAAKERLENLLNICRNVFNMFSFVYLMPIPLLFSLFVLAFCIWASLIHNFSNNQSLTVQKNWQLTNLSLATIAVFVVLQMSLFSRVEAVQELHLQPFRLLLMARDNNELYRSIFMNIIFFIPFGMFCSSTLSIKISIKKNILITTLIGLLISLFIETIQYFCFLGMTEFDDLICNTLGAFLGTIPLIIQKLYNNYNSK